MSVPIAAVRDSKGRMGIGQRWMWHLGLLMLSWKAQSRQRPWGRRQGRASGAAVQTVLALEEAAVGRCAELRRGGRGEG